MNLLGNSFHFAHTYKIGSLDTKELKESRFIQEEEEVDSLVLKTVAVCHFSYAYNSENANSI